MGTEKKIPEDVAIPVPPSVIRDVNVQPYKHGVVAGSVPVNILPVPLHVVNANHKCDFCDKPATHCYREGQGTGHSEHVCACVDHQESDE